MNSLIPKKGCPAALITRSSSCYLEINCKMKEPLEETLYDRPIIDKSKKSVSGPFTVEAVPSQRVEVLKKWKSVPRT